MNYQKIYVSGFVVEVSKYTFVPVPILQEYTHIHMTSALRWG